MAANNMKYLMLSASIAVFISIAQADQTFKANYTLTKIPKAYSSKPEAKTFGHQQKGRLRNSVVTTFKSTKSTKGQGRNESVRGLSVNDSATLAATAPKSARNIQKSSAHKKLHGFGPNSSNKPYLKTANSIRKTRQFGLHNELRNTSAVTFVNGPNLWTSKHVKQGKQATLVPTGSIVETSEPTKKVVRKLNKLYFGQHNKSDLRDTKTPKQAKNKHRNKPLKEKLHKKPSKNIRQLGKRSRATDHYNSPQFVNYDSSETKYPIGGCWAAMEGDVATLFRAMNVLNEKYQKAREDFTKEIGGPLFDKEMYDVMLWNRSVSQRALFKAGGLDAAVPAGLPLGGHAVLEDGNSLLFFHRLKLRNKTSFFLHPIKNDLMNTVLHAELSLGDLHLAGNYERLKIARMHPGNLYYAPTYGGLDFLLRDVKFEMQGRYRVANGHLLLEQVVSNITGKDALMIYTEVPKLRDGVPNPIVKFNNLDDFVDRLKIDLNHWVKDYFNDYLTYFGLASKRANADYQSYDRQKTMMHNNFVDHVVRLIRWKLHAITNHIEPRISDNSSRLYFLPNFTITILNEMKLKCSKGVVHGLSSIYRRSTSTGPSYATYALWREVDAVVGFSALKVVYRIEAATAEGPPMEGQLILTANDLTAHMAVDLYANNPAIYLHFDEIHPMQVQTLTVEGPVNQMIGSFKHVLENHIVALLVNVLVDQVKQLDNVFKCPGYEHRALEPPPKMKPLDDVGPNEQDNHLDSEVDSNDPDVQNENVNKDTERSTEEDHREPDSSDEDSSEEPGLPNGSAHVVSDAKDGESSEDPRLPAEDHREPNTKYGDSNYDESSLCNNYSQGDQMPKEVSCANNGQLPPEKVKPRFNLEKSESVELELPKNVEHNKARQVHVEVKEQFKVFGRKDKERLRGTSVGKRLPRKD